MGEPTEEAQTGDLAEVEGNPTDVEPETGVEPVVVESAELDPAESGPTVEELEERLEETRERLLRSLADSENYRKRSQRELADSRRFAAAEPITEFLVIVDNLELALSSEGSLEDLHSGVEMIVVQTKKLLARFGVEEVAAEGVRFDPSLHDAIARFEDSAVSTPMVSEELQKGYLMNGRLLRPAMVKVAVPVEAPSSEEEDGE